MKYDQVSQQASIVAGGGWTRLFNRNARRVTILFASSDGTLFLFNTRDTGVGGVPIAAVGGTMINVMHYRDFGPIVQDEIWVRAASSSPTVNVTEIFYTGER